MSDIKDFVIEDGVLKKYVGAGGDVVIPEGVVEISEYAFSRITTLPNGRQWALDNDALFSVVMPNSVVHISECAFEGCKELQDVVFSDNLKTIGGGAFFGCNKLGKVILPASLESIGDKVFFGHMTTEILEFHGETLLLPEKKLSIFQYEPNKTKDYILFAPRLPLSVLKNHGLGEQATKTFVKRHNEYNDEISKEYIQYISSQKKKYIPLILKSDECDIIKKLFEENKITNKNFEKDYLLPAIQIGASKCVAFLSSVFKMEKAPAKTVNTLWNGENFSTDGKRLLKYKDDSSCYTYHVPDTTEVIEREAFFMTSLRSIFIPESVSKIRNGAFVAKSGIPLFVKLPDSLKKLPSEVFQGRIWVQDDDQSNSTKYYYVASSSSKIAEQTSCSSYSKGEQCPVYTGGPLDDLSPKAKSYAVRGFLYATENKLADLSAWEEGYLSHIKSHEKTYLKMAESNSFLLRLMLQNRLVSVGGVKALLKSDLLQGNAEAIALLLEYQNSIPTKKNKTEKDPLDDDSSEMKQYMNKQARKEKIKAQDSIVGIVFVASGELNNFGFTDEYTGAHDLSDLKEFLESRGAFLRSAVSSKTDYLICNDTSIQTAKVKKALELGTTIINEHEFLKMVADKQSGDGSLIDEI